MIVLRNNTTDNSEAGFTMIEVSMSLVFIAFIVLFLTASLMSLFSTYNKGVWLSKVDQAVRQMRLDISDSVKYAGRSIVLVDSDKKPYRLCSNGVSYLWNTESQLRKAKEAGGYDILLNHWDGPDGKTVPLKLVRILDITGSYCKSKIDSSKKIAKGDELRELIQPKIDNSNVQPMLNTGVALQSFNVVQGERPDSVGGKIVPELKRIVPILYIDGAISTEGINAPTRVLPDASKPTKWRVLADDDERGRWQCGDWIDNNGNGVRDENDTFKPNKGQFCANTQFNMTVYERGVIR